MKEIIHLSILYFNLFIRKKFFILYITLLLIISFFLIPNAKAHYVTFYIGDHYATPNQFWIGNISAIFSNISIHLILIFMVIGEKQENLLSNNYVYEITSPFPTNKIFIYKIIALFLVALSLLFILNLSIIVINFKQINLFYYLSAIVYFSIPFLLVLTVLCFMVEYLIKNNSVKLIIYYSLFLVSIFNDQFLDLFGIHELGMYLSNNISNSGSERFGVGYLPKTDRLNEVTLNKFTPPLHIIKKIGYLLICVLSIYLIKFMKLSSPIHSSEGEHLIKIDPIDINKIESIDSKVKPNCSLLTLLRKDFFLFTNSINKYNLLIITVIWGLMFFVSPTFYKFLLPLIFVLCLSTNTFLQTLFYYNIEYLEKISPFSSVLKKMSKFILIFGFYLVILLPYLTHIHIDKSLIVISFFIILSIFQIFFIEITKSKIIMEIIMIMIFASYFTGSPIFNIFLI